MCMGVGSDGGREGGSVGLVTRFAQRAPPCGPWHPRRMVPGDGGGGGVIPRVKVTKFFVLRQRDRDRPPLRHARATHPKQGIQVRRAVVTY